MERILLEPTPIELGLHREQYDELVQALRAEGYRVELVTPVETRGGLPDPQQVYDLTVRVGELANDAARIAALVDTIRKHLRGKIRRRRRPTREGCIYLPSGEAHRFDIPIDDD